VKQIREASPRESGPPGKIGSHGSALACSRGRGTIEIARTRAQRAAGRRIVSDFGNGRFHHTSTSISCSVCQVKPLINGARLWKKNRPAPEHIPLIAWTYEEDTEFFLRHAPWRISAGCGNADGEFFEMTMAILEDAGYQHYEISNYARAWFESVHNRAYWLGKDYLGIGPSRFRPLGCSAGKCLRLSRVHRSHSSGLAPRESSENLTDQMKRTERIALLFARATEFPPES